MTFAGWLTFLISTLGVSFIFFYCIYKVLSSKNMKKLHGIENTKEIEEDK